MVRGLPLLNIGLIKRVTANSGGTFYETCTMNSIFAQHFPAQNPGKSFLSSSSQAADAAEATRETDISDFSTYMDDEIDDEQLLFHGHTNSTPPLNEDVSPHFAPNTPPNATNSIPLSKEAEALVANEAQP